VLTLMLWWVILNPQFYVLLKISCYQVVGETGLGKSTFLRTLLRADDAQATVETFSSSVIPRTVDIQEAGNFTLESPAGDVKFVLYDTPGYGSDSSY